jgi:hypothetical protein
MQVENDYDKDVYNGDLGFIRGVDAEAGEVLVEFDGREVTYGRRSMSAGRDATCLPSGTSTSGRMASTSRRASSTIGSAS